MPGVPNALSGYFDFHAGRFTGWVEDLAGPIRGPILITVKRRGRTIFEHNATRDRGTIRSTFAFSATDTIGGVELIRETIELFAYNSAGDSGKLTLEGATALELIRETTGVPAEVILDLHFHQSGNARRHLRTGWSTTESSYTWTDGDDSFVEYDGPNSPGNYVLRLTLGAFIVKPDLKFQNTDIFIDGAFVQRFTFDSSHDQFIECKLHHEFDASRPLHEIRLFNKHAARPCDYSNSGDRRRLALRLRRLTVARLL